MEVSIKGYKKKKKKKKKQTKNGGTKQTMKLTMGINYGYGKT